MAQEKDRDFLIQLRKETMKPLLEAVNIFLNEEEHSARIDKYFSDTYVLVIENQKVGMIKYIENDDEV